MYEVFKGRLVGTDLRRSRIMNMFTLRFFTNVADLRGVRGFILVVIDYGLEVSFRLYRVEFTRFVDLPRAFLGVLFNESENFVLRVAGLQVVDTGRRRGYYRSLLAVGGLRFIVVILGYSGQTRGVLTVTIGLDSAFIEGYGKRCVIPRDSTLNFAPYV